MALVMERMNWVLDEIAPTRYLFGDDIWFRNGETEIAATWMRAFVARIELPTASGGRISPTEQIELLAIALPQVVTHDHARTFIARWNRSLDYWAQGIVRVSQVPSGQSTDFIDLDIYRALLKASEAAFGKAAQQGYDAPDEALTHTYAELMQYMSEGDGNGVCAHVRLRLEQEAVMTRDAFDATLEVVNESDTALEEIYIDVKVRRRTGEDATDLFAIRRPP